MKGQNSYSLRVNACEASDVWTAVVGLQPSIHRRETDGFLWCVAGGGILNTDKNMSSFPEEASSGVWLSLSPQRKKVQVPTPAGSFLSSLHGFFCRHKVSSRSSKSICHSFISGSKNSSLCANEFEGQSLTPTRGGGCMIQIQNKF